MTLERLGEESRARQDRALYLRFVAAPLGRAAYLRWHRLPRERLRSAGRFTTTGMFGRVVDAGMRASLLARGKVPGGLAAAAETTYREHLDRGRYTYYGRVVREAGYIVLQYWFFYAMNDWRSTFSGVNDHEADWEMVTIYLAEDEAGPRPAWVAFSSHDYEGDDLRRRWDDPELTREGDHPVVFAGAGSHSGAFVPGDYVVSVDPPQLRAVIRSLQRLRRALAPWRRGEPLGSDSSGFGIPFVDYARGDGTAIGPGQEAAWNPVVIGDDTPWVRDYRGLWGLDTHDRFSGERAPSGPRYERNGSVRASWANPLGWAGLQKVPPGGDDVPVLLRERVAALEDEMAELEDGIARDREDLRRLRAEAVSLRAHASAQALARERDAQVTEREAALDATIARRVALAEERRAHLDTLGRPAAPEAPQAHLRSHHLPYSRAQQRRTRFLTIWGVVSAPLLLASLILIVTAPPAAWISTVGFLAVVFLGVEAIARRRLLSFLASVGLLVLAVAIGWALLLAILDNWRLTLSVVLALAAVSLLVANIKDARRG